MNGIVHRSIVVALGMFLLMVPFAGNASAHHQEEGSYELRLIVDTPAGPVGQTVQVWEDPEDRGYTGPYIDAALARLCHVPPFECVPLDEDDRPDDSVELPLPDLPLPPLPAPPFLF